MKHTSLEWRYAHLHSARTNMFTLNVLLKLFNLKNNSKFKIILLDTIMVCGLTLITLCLLCAHNGYSLLL